MLAVVGAEIDEVDKVLVTCFALERIGEFPDTFSIRVNVAPDLDILVDKQELCIELVKEINRVQDMEGYNVVDSWLYWLYSWLSRRQRNRCLSSRLPGSGTNHCLRIRR